MRLLFFILLAILLIGCKKVEDNFTIYSISSHRSGVNIQRNDGNSVSGTAVFTQSCEYVLTENIGQINKLVGLSASMNGVHKNSIRIGWEYDGGFKLYSYYYIDGVRAHQYLTTVSTNEAFTFEVRIDSDQYYVRVNTEVFTIPHNIESINSWQLFPYFGGEAENPNSEDMKIKIKYN